MKLKEYWPPLLQEILDFSALATAQQPELDAWLTAVRQTPNDFFLSTLTEHGIQRWETILGIVPADGETLAQRREHIQILYADQLPYTFRALRDYLYTINPGISASLSFYEYLLQVQIPYGTGQISTIRRVLREMVPANVVVDISSIAPMTVYAGAVMGLDYGYLRL